MKEEIFRLYHIARVALADALPSRYDRMMYAKREYLKAHPESTLTPKALWHLIDEYTRVMS